MNSHPAYIRIAEQIKAEWFSAKQESVEGDNDADSGRKLPTQEELAEQYGVSRSTIVRSLSRLVAEGYIHSRQGSGAYVTLPAEKSGHAAAAHGAARSLSASVPPATAKSLGLLVPNLRSPIVMQACRGVEREARRRGYAVLLASSDDSLEREQELVEQHLQAGAAGIVLYPVIRHKHDEASDYLTTWEQAVPLVTMDIRSDRWPCSQVVFDNYRLGYDMTRQLLRHGHRHIAFMHAAGDRLHTSILDRQKGWEVAMEEACLPIPAGYQTWPARSHDGEYDDADFAAMAQELLALDPRPDAVIGWDDPAVARLIQALINEGMRVPEEMRVAGFDAHPLITRLFRPLFPTSKPDFARLGELAVEVLAACLQEGSALPRTYYLPVSVQWREARPIEERAAPGREEAPLEV